MRDPVYNRCNGMKCLIWRDKIEAVLEGNFQAPVVLNVFATNRCDHQCGFCAMKDEMRRFPDDMATGTLLKAVSDCVRHDIKTIHFTGGGEPLLHPHLREAISAAKGGGRNVAVTTNGSRLDDSAWFASNVDYLRVSLDAANPATYAKIHGVGEEAFAIVIQQIRAIAQQPRRGDLGLSFIICQDNWREIQDFARLAAGIGVDFAHIRPARWDGQGANPLAVREPEILTLTALAEKELGEKIEIYSINFRYDSHWAGRNYSRCRATPLRATLGADGAFRLCPDRVEIAVGDYTRNGFWQAWGAERHKEIINRVRVNECPRCVASQENEVIENVFVEDKLRLALI